MKTEYGISVPRGVQKDWDACSMGQGGAGEYLRTRHVPADWGDPIRCVAWFDRFGRCRICIGQYANGREAVVRSDANNNHRTTFTAGPAQIEASDAPVSSSKGDV